VASATSLPDPAKIVDPVTVTRRPGSNTDSRFGLDWCFLLLKRCV